MFYSKNKRPDIEELKKQVKDLQKYLPFYGKVITNHNSNIPNSPLGRIDRLSLNKKYLHVTIVQERLGKDNKPYDEPPTKLKIPIDEVDEIFAFKTVDGQVIISKEKWHANNVW